MMALSLSYVNPSMSTLNGAALVQYDCRHYPRVTRHIAIKSTLEKRAPEHNRGQNVELIDQNMPIYEEQGLPTEM